MENKSKKEKKANLLAIYGLITFGVIFLLLSALLIYNVQSVRKPVRKIFEDGLNTNADLISKSFKQWIEDKIVMLDDFKLTVADPEDTKASIVEYLSEKPTPKGFSYIMVAFDEDKGIGTYSSEDGYNASSTINKREYYEAHLKGEDLFFGKIYVNNRGIESIPIMRSLSYIDLNSGENKTGVFVGFLDLADLKTEFDINFYNTGHTCIKEGIGDHTSILVGKEPDLEKETVVEREIKISNMVYTLKIGVENSEVNSTAADLSKKVLATGIPVGVTILIFVLLIIASLFRKIGMVKKQMDNLSSGDKDLTSRFSVTRKDQVQDILSSINTFLDQIHSTVKKINDSKIVLEDAAKNLNSKVLASNSDLSEIAKSMDVSSQAIDVQKNAISSTASAVTQISSNIDSLNKMIEGQASAITEASASIEEMVGNINSVTSSVESMAGEFEELSKATEVGTEKNNVVSSLLSRISETSVVLVNANDAIAAIAEQTNLLAMNAAIEAAHAGEAGKGFAVVADEIRKLAETSSEQSDAIGNQLKEITDSIKLVVDASGESSDAFVRINSQIENTTNLVNQIRNAMEEQQTGSRQVLEALGEMNNSTSEVKSASEEMKNGSENIMHTIADLEKAQSDFQKSADEMTGAIRRVSQSIQDITRLDNNLGDCVKNIDQNVNQFKI